MEIADDLMSSLRGQIGTDRGSALPGGIDWHGLHSRLAAAHAARSALAQGGSSVPTVSGGFAVLTETGHPSRHVNPTDLADGKAPAGNDWAIAGQAMTGGRGQ
jgi:hypothetical protein